MRPLMFTTLSLALVSALGCGGPPDSGAPLALDSGGALGGAAGGASATVVGAGPAPRSAARPARSSAPGRAASSGARAADDLDGDGQSAAEGDCDDADPAVSGGAPERCNGEDDDCDGVVDEPGLSVRVHVVAKNEGARWAAAVDLEGCADRARLLAAPTEAIARCGLSAAPERGPQAHELGCELVDDGVFDVILEASDPAGAVAWARARGEVTNVPPVVTGLASPIVVQLEAEGDDSGLGAASGEPLRRVFRSLDLGEADVARWSLEGAPPGMTLAEDGVLRFTPTEADLGAWRAVVVSTDDDGGSGELAFPVDVRRADDADGGLGCCCFGATAALVLPLRVLLRRRPRGHPKIRSEHVRSSREGRL